MRKLTGALAMFAEKRLMAGKKAVDCTFAKSTYIFLSTMTTHGYAKSAATESNLSPLRPTLKNGANGKKQMIAGNLGAMKTQNWRGHYNSALSGINYKGSRSR